MSSLDTVSSLYTHSPFMTLKKLFAMRPIIAACTYDRLQQAITSRAKAVLLMSCRFQDLMSNNFAEVRKRKPVFVHFEFVRGLDTDREAVHLMHEFANPAAIVSTKGPILRAAAKEGLPTIQRIFLIDSQSLQKSIASIQENEPYAVEVMPGIAPQVLPLLRGHISQPIILGGLLYTESLVHKAFEAGADALSMSNEELWNTDAPLTSKTEM